jgi:Flp pilus assembly protein TadB
MNTQMFAQTIQLILAPVVMISACAIIVTSLVARYATVNDRLRAMARERLDLLRATHGPLEGRDVYIAERMAQIDHQAPELVGRHKLLHDAILAAYCAISVFIFCMLAIAAAVVSSASIAATGALLLFLVGLCTLLCSVLVTTVEVRRSHNAVDYEIGRVLALKDAGQ